MNRVFKTKHFHRAMKKSGLSDKTLCAAVKEMQQGLIDADLGGGVFKKRVALTGRGKSGGARTLLASNQSDRWFFLFGFQKNERDNVSADELRFLKLTASTLLALTERQLAQSIAVSELTEICHGQH